ARDHVVRPCAPRIKECSRLTPAPRGMEPQGTCSGDVEWVGRQAIYEFASSAKAGLFFSDLGGYARVRQDA
ncbi:MAG: hypothetical protein ACLQFR_12600, partial [Streptosporangiaceae bacterium]